MRGTTVRSRLPVWALIKETRGVTAIEYALIAALIAVAAIAAFTLVGSNLSSTFSFDRQPIVSLFDQGAGL